MSGMRQFFGWAGDLPERFRTFGIMRRVAAIGLFYQEKAVPFPSVQVAMTILVGLLGLIALIVAARIRHSAPPKPRLTAAYARPVSRASRGRHGETFMLAPQEPLADDMIERPVVMRDAPKESWGRDDPLYRDTRKDALRAQRAEGPGVDHTALVDYL
jgi:hypothetical protein